MTRGASGDPLHWASQAPRAPEDPFALPVRGDASMGVVRRPGEAHLVNYPPLSEPQLLPPAAGGQEVYWYKAQADWQDNSGDPRVSCKKCADRSGAGVTGAAVWVWLPHRAGEDPNVRADEVIPVFLMPDDALLCALDTSDGKVGSSVRIWLTGTPPGTLPAGWEVFSEADNRFLKVYQPTGETGGAADHTHEDHAPHAHGGETSFHDEDIQVSRVDPCDQWVTWGHLHDIPEHPGFSHSDESNEPPWYSIMLIKRTS